MNRAKGTRPKALQMKLQQQQEEEEEGGRRNISNKGKVEGEGESSSFRVLYYGSASAGSVPFMWESQPGTPKHALTQSSLPPLTPPPSYFTPNHNNNSSKTSGFLRSIFLSSSRKPTRHSPNPSSFSSPSISSSSFSSLSSSSSHLQSTPVRRLEEDCGGSPTSTLCFGQPYGVKKLKKAMLSFVRHHGNP